MDYRDFVRPKFVDLLQALGLECEFKRALGSQLFYRNRKGDEVTVTDFLGGYGAALFGHNDPQFVEQLCTLLRNDVPFNAQMSIRGTAGALARALSEAFNRELKNNEQYISTFSNSGAEAVEIAVKHAEFRRQKNLQRQKVREMMAEWDQRYPGRTESVFTALQNIVPSHLADNALFNFKGLRVGKELEEMDGGDTVFDGPQFGADLSLPAIGAFNLVNA